MPRESLPETKPSNLNGSSKESPAIEFPLPKKDLEADAVFPFDPKSAYLSSYYPDSYKFPYNPDPLARSNNYAIYDEMRSDDQVKAAVSFKKDQILAPGWQIKCDNEEIVEAIEQNLKSLEVSFEDSLRDILSAFEYGFSMTEPVYKRGDKGLIELKDLKTRPPHGFEFHVDKKGDVEKVVQNAAEGAIDFKPDYFLHHVYQPQFGNPFGRSDLNSAHTAWKAKKFIFRFWAVYVERFASPTVVAEYPPEFDTTKVSRLQTIINSIQHATNLLVPLGTKLDFKMANRDSSNIYENAITLLNTMIARSVLMPDLMGLSGEQTSGGSFALGKTQFDMFLGMVRREQQALARKISRKIIEPMARANWGDVQVEFEINAHSDSDAMDAYRLWLDAVKAKVWTADEKEIKHFLDGIKFPVPETIVVPEPINPFDPNNPNGMNPKDMPANGKPPIPPQQQKPEGDTEDKEKPSPDLFHQRTYREQTKHESTVNFAEIKKTLERAEETAVNKLKTLARDIYKDFIDQIKDRNLLGRFKPDLINDLAVKHLKPMNMEMKAFMKGAFTSAYNHAQKEIFPKVERKFALGEDLLPEEFLEIVEAESFKMVGDYSVNITNKMRNQLVQGLKQGTNERDLLAQLREIGDNETDKWLRTVIRTKTTEMFNRGRKSYWETDEFAKQLIVAYQFSAIMDDRTSEVCRTLDGKVFEVGQFTNDVVPPLHFNCRSLWVPVTKFEEYEASNPISLKELKDMGGKLI